MFDWWEQKRKKKKNEIPEVIKVDDEKMHEENWYEQN